MPRPSLLSPPCPERSQRAAPWLIHPSLLSPLSSLLLLLAGLALSAVEGCAGGGSGAPAALTVPLNPKVRMLQQGDTATYTFTGTFTGTGLLPVSVIGSTVHSITSKVGDILTVTHNLHIIIDGNPFDLVQTGTEQQNPDGSIVPVSDYGGVNGALRTVTSNTFVQPGTFMVPMTITGSTTFSDGSSSQSTMTVTQTSSAITAVGSFGVYVVNQSVKSSFGNSSTTVDYFSPPMGFFITRTETASGPTGVITLHYVMQSTNVPL